MKKPVKIKIGKMNTFLTKQEYKELSKQCRKIENTLNSKIHSITDAYLNLVLYGTCKIKLDEE